MTEAVVSGKDTCGGIFINDSDDLLTLKKVVSTKTDKDVEKQKLNTSVETDGSELSGNRNKTDSIHSDVNNTSSIELNFEMDSDTDLNTSIGSIRTQEDRESETNNISNENSIEVNQADVNNGEKDIEESSIKSQDVSYSASDLSYNNDSDDLEDDYPDENSELNYTASPASSFNISAREPIRSYNVSDSSSEDDNSDNLEDDYSDDTSELNYTASPASYFNISAREPIRSYNVSDSSSEDDNFLLEKEVLNNKRKRKFEDLGEQDQKPSKILKLWSWMKYPFQKKTYRPSISENTQNSFETDDGINNKSCNIM